MNEEDHNANDIYQQLKGEAEKSDKITVLEKRIKYYESELDKLNQKEPHLTEAEKASKKNYEKEVKTHQTELDSL